MCVQHYKRPARVTRRTTMKFYAWRTQLAAAFVVIAAMVLAGCGGQPKATVVEGPWDQVVAAAKTEGQVNLYTSLAPIQISRLVDAFHMRYPDIRVNVTRGAGQRAA